MNAMSAMHPIQTMIQKSALSRTEQLLLEKTVFIVMLTLVQRLVNPKFLTFLSWILDKNIRRTCVNNTGLYKNDKVSVLIFRGTNE